MFEIQICSKETSSWPAAKNKLTKPFPAHKAVYLANVATALERAYKSAVETARQTNTYLVV